MWCHACSRAGALAHVSLSALQLEAKNEQRAAVAAASPARAAATAQHESLAQRISEARVKLAAVQEERTALEAEMPQLQTEVDTAEAGLGNGALAAMKDAQLLEGVAVTASVQVSDPASVLRVAARAAAAAKTLN